jgi:ribonuclease BN (tRNA processing enzyme)
VSISRDTDPDSGPPSPESTVVGRHDMYMCGQVPQLHMEITLLGTGTPIPVLERGGTAIAVEAGEETLLFDCGPMTVHRMTEFDVDPTAIEHLFFTHHHLDHNAEFYHFAVLSWFLGRDSLTVYGPDGTAPLVDAMEPAFENTLESWGGWKDEQFGHDPDRGIGDVETVQVTDDLRVEGDGWTVTALAVDHQPDIMETFAYRVDETASGTSFVFSADTAPVPALGSFAAGADVLVHEANAWESRDNLLDEDEIPDRYTTGAFEPYYAAYTSDGSRAERSRFHSTPTAAAELAEEAGVETLVLTHLNPYRDVDGVRAAANSVFDGEVRIAEDGLSLSTGGEAD